VSHLLKPSPVKLSASDAGQFSCLTCRHPGYRAKLLGNAGEEINIYNIAKGLTVFLGFTFALSLIVQVSDQHHEYLVFSKERTREIGLLRNTGPQKDILTQFLI